MRKTIFVIALAAMLPLASPAVASPEEVMPEVEETHDSILMKIFGPDAVLGKLIVKTGELIERNGYDEEKEQWMREWGGCCTIGIRG